MERWSRWIGPTSWSSLREKGLDALIAIGGDGSLGIARVLQEKGLPVVGVPKTIDNDLEGTVITFGFDTAVSFATECIDRLHTTAASHRRVMVVEVMGRYAGWIALNCGVSALLTSSSFRDPHDLDVGRRSATGSARRSFSIVVVAEAPAQAEVSFWKKIGSAERLEDRPEARYRAPGDHGKRISLRGSGTPPSWRHAHRLRSPDLASLRSGGGSVSRRGHLRSHGRARSAARAARSPGGSDATDEVVPLVRHDSNGADLHPSGD
jgi:hypothetical protein